MDTSERNEKRKRKRRTSDQKQIQCESEPAAKRQKISFDPPAELLFEIFKYYDPTDLIIMGRVCKYWNECASARYRWRLFSSCFLSPTGVSWDIESYLHANDGFLKADVKYISPNGSSIRDVHSFELYYKGEYLARQEILLSFRYTHSKDVRLFEQYIGTDTESNFDTDSWTVEARLIPQPTRYQDVTYQIGFGIYFNELVLLSAIRNRRKFPKKELIFKNLDSELAHIRNDNLYHQYWNATTHPHVPETLVDPTIFGDSVKLFDHQHKAVSWMLYIESLPEVSYSLLLSWSKSPNIFIDLWQKELVPIDDIKKHEFSFKPKGGILADDFGLGKTLTAVCLVLADKKLNKIKADLPAKQSGRFSSNATLVICPAALIDQWQDEIARFNNLSVLVMTEPNQTMKTAADIVLLSADLLQEFARIGSVLFNTSFRRVIVDESHSLLPAYNTIQQLSKTYAWCLSATPIPSDSKYIRYPFITPNFANATVDFLEIPLPVNVEELIMEVRQELLIPAYLSAPPVLNPEGNGSFVNFSRQDKITVARYNRHWMMLGTLMWCTKRGHAPELNFSSSTPEIIRIDLTPFEQAVIESSRDLTQKVAIVAGVGCYHKTLDDMKVDAISHTKSFLAYGAAEVESMTQYLKRLESIPFLAADPEADEKSQMINLFGSKLAEIVRWVQENVIEENKKCIIFSKNPSFLGYISFVLEQNKIESLLFTKFLNDGNLFLKMFKNAKSGILLAELSQKMLPGLHFNNVDYIILLDLLSEPANIEDENFKLALATVTSLGNDPSHKVKHVRFVVNNSIDEELFHSPENVTKQLTFDVKRVMEDFQSPQQSQSIELTSSSNNALTVMKTLRLEGLI